MKCQFCGYDNPQGKDVCEKCNKPLVEFASRHIQEGEMKESVNHDRPTERKSNSGFNPKATVRENFRRAKYARNAVIHWRMANARLAVMIRMPERRGITWHLDMEA